MLVERALRISAQHSGAVKERNTLIICLQIQDCMHSQSPHLKKDLEQQEKTLRRIKGIPVRAYQVPDITGDKMYYKHFVVPIIKHVKKTCLMIGMMERAMGFRHLSYQRTMSMLWHYQLAGLKKEVFLHIRHLLVTWYLCAILVTNIVLY